MGSSLQDIFDQAPEPRLDDQVPQGAWDAASLDEALASWQEGSAGIAAAVIYLCHGRLSAAHDLANGIGGSDGDFAHALMHRMEGDLDNACYWHGRHGWHPVHDQIAKALTNGAINRPVDLPDYGPAALTEALRTGLAIDDPDALALHQAEVTALFAHCVQRSATASDRANDSGR